MSILVVGAAAVWAFAEGPTPPDTEPRDQTSEAVHLFHIDVAGWYRTTPDERVVLARYDLHSDVLLESLPYHLADWSGSDLGPTTEIDEYYGKPDLVLRRQYEDSAGDVVWLTVIASQGPKSFHLFEHTPHICYGGEWDTLTDDTHRIQLAAGELPARRGVFRRDGDCHVVYYWYQWNTPSRDSADGIASWRLSTEARNGVPDAEDRLAAFANLLYRETLPWHRF